MNVKIRVWDNWLGYFLQPSISGNPFVFVEDGHNYNLEESHPSHVFQLSSGLRYKNGNHIFEGDILNTIEARWEVKYKNGAFYAIRVWTGLDPISVKSECLLSEIHDRSIQIGNILEHPELLKVGG